ncbi:hypothetical protein BC629DRAFT_10160 [Irpex lacteus]|nr:hypothetical protein BC629DRAFT_10160 [Irpex lacteus]
MRWQLQSVITNATAAPRQTRMKKTVVELAPHFIRTYMAFHIHTTCWNCGRSEAMDRVVMHNVVHNPYDYNFVHVIADSLVHAFLKDDTMCLEVINLLLQGYFDVATLGKARPIRDPTHLRKYCYLRRVLQVHWLPVLDKLRTTLREGRRTSSLSSAHIQTLKDIIETWEELGLDFNLSERSREDDRGLTNYVTEKEKQLGCFNAECPCYGEKPLHGIRRICTGCWAVFYCGERCQKRDWKAGHKSVCERRQKPSTVQTS